MIKDAWITNAMLYEIFLQLRTTQLFLCFLGQSYHITSIYLSIQLAGFLFHPQWVSFSPRWKTYSKVSPPIILKI